MIVGICGEPFCGKKTVANYLVEHHNFQYVDISEVLAKKAVVDQDVVTDEQSAGPTDDTLEETKDPSHVSKQQEHQGFTDRLEALITELRTQDWRKSYVLTPVIECQAVQQLVKAQKIIIYRVVSPLKLRLKRSGLEDQLERFIELTSEYQEANLSTNRLEVMSTFSNHYSSMQEFHTQELVKFDFADTELVRPKWDRYFMTLAKVVSSRTNCMKRAVGCVIVRDNRIVATGYNGTPFGLTNCNEGGCARCNQMTPSGFGLDECHCIHAEENAIIEGGRTKTDGGTAYVTTYPCLSCSKTLVQAGIKRVVYDRDYPMPSVRKFFDKIAVVSLEQLQL